MKSLMVRFVREDEGQDLIEYTLLATVIALVVFVGASLARNVAELLVHEHQQDRRQVGRARAQVDLSVAPEWSHLHPVRPVPTDQCWYFAGNQCCC